MSEVVTTEPRSPGAPAPAARAEPSRDGSEGPTLPDTRSHGRLLVILGLCVAMALLTLALMLTGLKNPTPTNTNSGGVGSRYPGMHQVSSYQNPIGGEGPQSS